MDIDKDMIVALQFSSRIEILFQLGFDLVSSFARAPPKNVKQLNAYETERKSQN